MGEDQLERTALQVKVKAVPREGRELRTKSQMTTLMPTTPQQLLSAS
jgi:hypothetical protein